MNIDIELVHESDKSIIRNLMQLYLYDFSLYSKENLNCHGEYSYSRLDYYWVEEGRYPYIVRVDNEIAGFCLIRRLDDCSTYSIAEFFIVKKYRRKGVGKKVANQIFNKYKGNWEVGVLRCNEPAIKYWDKVLDEYKGSDYRIENKEGWEGIVYKFESNR